MTYELHARRRSTVENIDSRYDESCDCWYTAGSEDRIGEGSSDTSNGVVYFDGFAPSPLPACSNGKDDDGDGQVDHIRDQDCGSADDNDEAPHPCSDGKDSDYHGSKDSQDVDARPANCDSTSSRQSPPPTQCGDGKDNDRDSVKDEEDRDCADTEDTTEDVFQLPPLTIGDAKRYAKVALKRYFKGSYSSGYAKKLSSCSRTSKTRIVCKRVSWVVGDLAFGGKVTIWYTRQAGLRGSNDVQWNYAWTIKRLDEYCSAVLKKKRCVKTYRVK